MRFFTAVLGFVLASVLLTVLAVIFQTGFVMSMLAEVGAEIGLGEAVSMIFDDLVGFGPIYGALIAIGLVIAFPSAAFFHRLTKLPRELVFACAGAVCMLVMLLAMEQVFFGVQLVAGARTGPGLIGQILAGGLGGLAYAMITAPPRPNV